MTGLQPALRGIAAALALSHAAAAQSGTSDAGEEGDCVQSSEPLECPERCPSFDTCIIADDEDGRLYYRVADQRFDCAGLDCRAASTSLGDYCCARGQFAPPKKGGGGCILTGARPEAGPSGSQSAGLWLGALAVVLAVRRRRPVRPAAG